MACVLSLKYVQILEWCRREYRTFSCCRVLRWCCRRRRRVGNVIFCQLRQYEIASNISFAIFSIWLLQIIISYRYMIYIIGYVVAALSYAIYVDCCRCCFLKRRFVRFWERLDRFQRWTTELMFVTIYFDTSRRWTSARYISHLSIKQPCTLFVVFQKCRWSRNNLCCALFIAAVMQSSLCDVIIKKEALEQINLAGDWQFQHDVFVILTRVFLRVRMERAVLLMMCESGYFLLHRSQQCYVACIVSNSWLLCCLHCVVQLMASASHGSRLGYTVQPRRQK